MANRTGNPNQPTPQRAASGLGQDIPAALLDAVDVPILGLDQRGRICQVNRACENLSGYTGSEMQGKYVWDFLPAAEAKTFKATFKQLPKASLPYRVEQTWLTKSGEPCHLSWSYNRLNGEQTTIYWVATGIEAGPYSHTEVALEESERRLATLMSNLPGYVYRVANDPNYTPEFVSEGVITITGYEQREYLVDRTISCGQEIHPDDVSRVWDAVQQAVAAQEPYECVYRIITKSGEEKWVWERGRGIFSNRGDLLHLEGFVTDINVSKQAEAEQERLIALIESSSDLIALSNMAGQLTFINQAGRQLVGIPSLEAVQQTTIADYFGDEATQRLHAEVLPTVFSSGSWRGELKMRHFQTGESIPVFFNSTLVRDPQTSEPIGLGTVGREIRDIHRIDQERRQAEAALHSLMVGTATVTGKDFFPILAEQVATTLGVKHVVVSALVDDQLQALAFWSDGKLQPDFSYAYLNTPCELSIQRGIYACPVGLQEQFPQDHNLALLDAESYLGVAMQNRRGEPIGTLCLVDTKPLENVDRTETILRIFAARAAAEFERQQATQALETLNRDLESRIQQRTAELQASEHALQDSQTLLQLVMDNLPQAVFWKDQDCRFLGCNRQMLKDAGLPSVEAIIGKTDFDMPWHEEAHLYRTDDREVIASGQPKLNIEEPITKVGNAYRWLRTNKLPLHNASGEVIGVLGTYEDITDQKALESQLLQSNERLALLNLELSRATRLKDEFLANMSHELRTPLSSILGMTQALRREIYGSLSERQQKSVGIIERSGRHLLALINDILDLAKIESGKLELNPGPVSVEALCNTSLLFIQQQALQKHIHITCQIAPELSTLEADELRLKQALINLLDNAVKFTPQGGHIDLEVSLAPRDPASAIQDVLFAVTDTGIGIRPEDQPRLFQAFVQLDSSLTRQYAGTGLGLALVKRIIEMHGGTVEVESEVEVGSRFMLRLPYQPGDARQVSPATQTANHRPHTSPSPLTPIPASPSPPRILVVEDNIANQQMLRDILEIVGYSVETADDGEAAVRMAEAKPPELILMDIQMPKMDGLEVMRRLRANPKFQQLPIIALTALVMPGDRERCLEAGASDYLPKPVQMDDLTAMLRSWL